MGEFVKSFDIEQIIEQVTKSVNQHVTFAFSLHYVEATGSPKGCLAKTLTFHLVADAVVTCQELSVQPLFVRRPHHQLPG